jgi:hypothetical protein
MAKQLLSAEPMKVPLITKTNSWYLLEPNFTSPPLLFVVNPKPGASGCRIGQYRHHPVSQTQPP